MINPILLVAIPLLAAFLSIMVKKLSKVFLFGVSLFTIIGSFFIENGSYVIGGWEPPFGINLVVDDYSFLILILQINPFLSWDKNYDRPQSFQDYLPEILLFLNQSLSEYWH